MKKGVKRPVKERERRWKKIDLILMIVFPIAAIILSMGLNLNYLLSTILFFGVPSLYLSIRKKSLIKKTTIFSFLFIIPISIIIDYLGIRDNSWWVPQTVFGMRFFGGIPFEDLVWSFLIAYFVVSFYEFFLDRKDEPGVKKHMNYLIGGTLIVFFIFIIFLIVSPGILHVPYAYLWMGILTVIAPLITFLSFFPKLIGRYTILGAYFFFVTLLQEIATLHLNNWQFLGTNFIGWFELFGYRFPVEEFILYISLMAAAIAVYYEFFDDDQK